MKTVALVGRPNVGKSSLFNRLVGKQMAIVDNTPGVTRDYKVSEASLGDLTFMVMDTAGLEQISSVHDPLHQMMMDKTVDAVRKADVLIFVLDGIDGITAIDMAMATMLRQWNKPVIPLVNKVDVKKAEQTGYDVFKLGLGEPVLFSTAHSIGFRDLEEALQPHIGEVVVEEETDEYELAKREPALPDIDEGQEVVIEEDDPNKPIKIAIVGRPNVGKSTLLNCIIGEERAITSPIAGTTRDAVIVQWIYRDRPFRLVDTAGLRKRHKIIDRIEKMSVAETQRAIRLAHIVVLVLDAEQALDHQDQAIADHVIQEGRALIIAVNKSDLIKDHDAYRKDLRERLGTHISQVKDIPMVTVSALNSKGVQKLLDGILDVYGIWQSRVPTAKLNRWIEGIEAHNPPPMSSGRANRLRYMTQIKSRPPTFALWVSRPDDIPDSYHRFLVNRLRETFDLPGIAIRLYFRRSKNPYGDKKD